MAFSFRLLRLQAGAREGQVAALGVDLKDRCGKTAGQPQLEVRAAGQVAEGGHAGEFSQINPGLTGGLDRLDILGLEVGTAGQGQPAPAEHDLHRFDGDGGV